MEVEADVQERLGLPMESSLRRTGQAKANPGDHKHLTPESIVR